MSPAVAEAWDRLKAAESAFKTASDAKRAANEALQDARDAYSAACRKDAAIRKKADQCAARAASECVPVWRVPPPQARAQGWWIVESFESGLLLVRGLCGGERAFEARRGGYARAYPTQREQLDVPATIEAWRAHCARRREAIDAALRGGE